MIQFQKRAGDRWNALVDGFQVARVDRKRNAKNGVHEYVVTDFTTASLGAMPSQIQAFDLVRQRFDGA